MTNGTAKQKTRSGIWAAGQLLKYIECENCLLVPYRGDGTLLPKACRIVRCKKHYQEDEKK